jgi:hypothetical protein
LPLLKLGVSRLVKAGAHIIVPDFSQHRQFTELLQVEKTDLPDPLQNG